MNRRELVGGALGLVGCSYLSQRLALAAMQMNDIEVVGPPRNLLSKTFTPQLLRDRVLVVSAWHPYPRAGEGDAWSQVRKELREALIRRAEAVKGKEWPSLLATTLLEYKRDGNRSDYESQMFARRHRLVDLVLGECVEGDGRFLDDIANGVWLTCEETFWGAPAHLGAQKAKTGLPDEAEPIIDLFAAETAATLAWTAYLIGGGLNKVSPLIVPRIRMEAKRRILDPALERDDFGWMGLTPKRGRLNNWNPWINSNWLTTNLLLEQDPEKRVQAVSKIWRSLDEFLIDYSPDGACEEGPVYWQASAGAYFNCCWTLASATGGAADVLTNPFVRKMGRYIADVHIANNAYVNYGDAHMEDAPTPELLYRFGAGTRDEVLERFGAFYSEREGFLASSPALDRAVAAGLPNLWRSLAGVMAVGAIQNTPKEDALGRDSWYPALKLMTARAKGGTTDGFYLAVQAASNGRSHGHNDSGSFIVFHDGEPVFIDVGVEAYTAKTFSAERYTIWTMQSAYHNLPTIGGVMQHEGTAYQASAVRYSSDDAVAEMAMNLATAYPAQAGVRRWLRQVLLDRQAGNIRLNEDFELERRVPVVLSLMTSRVPSEGAKGTIVLRSTRNNVHDVLLKYHAAQLRFSFEKITLSDEGLRRSWGPEIYRIQLHSTDDLQTAKWPMEIVAG